MHCVLSMSIRWLLECSAVGLENVGKQLGSDGLMHWGRDAMLAGCCRRYAIAQPVTAAAHHDDLAAPVTM